MRVFIADVAVFGDNVSAAQTRLHLFKLCRIDIAKNELGARARKSRRGEPAEAACRTRDQYNLILVIGRHSDPLARLERHSARARCGLDEFVRLLERAGEHLLTGW